MSKQPTADYLAMARSMRYSDLTRVLLRKWNAGSLGAGILLYLYAGGSL